MKLLIEYAWIVLGLILFAVGLYVGRGPITHCEAIGDVIALGCR